MTSHDVIMNYGAKGLANVRCGRCVNAHTFSLDLDSQRYTLKTGVPVEEGDSILKLLRRVSRPQIQLGVVHSDKNICTNGHILATTALMIGLVKTSHLGYFLARVYYME